MRRSALFAGEDHSMGEIEGKYRGTPVYERVRAELVNAAQ